MPALTLALSSLVWSNNALAEPDESPITSFFFVDTYAAASQDSPPSIERDYVTQAGKNGGPHLNLLAAGTAFDNKTVRAKLAAQYGDSVDANYAAEPQEAWRLVQEGYIGTYLSPDVSVDAGVFFAHIGAESWLNTYNPTYTRSLMAEFSPYYESGGRLTYALSDEWTGKLLVLNGWQNISEARHPALGTSLSWTDSKLTVTSTTFAGNENNGTRLFHDLIVQRKFESGAQVSGTVDVGHQDAPDLAAGWWWGYSIIGRTPLTESLALNGRVESYQDPNAVITTPPSGTPFRVYGISVGTDLDIGSGFTVRTEGKHLMGVDKVFLDNSSTSRTDTLFVISLSWMRTGLL